MSTPSTDAYTLPDADRALDVDRGVGSLELQRYRRTCHEVDRLLDQGRLSEALRLNEEARTLFRSLFSAGKLGASAQADS